MAGSGLVWRHTERFARESGKTLHGPRMRLETVVLDQIPYRAHMPSLTRRLRMTEDSADLSDLRQLVEKAEVVARPKALYAVGYIEERGDEHVVIDAVTFTSRILRVNLEHAHRAFVYVATCGTELEMWARSLTDLLQRYWAEAIQEAALREATQTLDRVLAERYRPGKTSAMAPGSLGEWPLSEQRALFAALGDVKGAIGVELTDSLLMIPAKSVSGIRFPTTESFESCQLCPRADCPGRRAPYDRTLYDRRYRGA